MKTILKITFVCLAVLAFNSVNAQNALTKKNIKKSEATTSVKRQSLATETSVRQEGVNPSIQTQPIQVKPATATQAKSPAQMAGKPLQKKTVSQQKGAVESKSVK